VAVTELTPRYDPRRLVFFQIAGTAVVAALATALFERPQIHWTPRVIGALLYTVLFATTICFLLQMRAQREMSTARAALIFCFEPLFAAVTFVAHPRGAARGDAVGWRSVDPGGHGAGGAAGGSAARLNSVAAPAIFVARLPE
jgi:hypothetical protein